MAHADPSLEGALGDFIAAAGAQRGAVVKLGRSAEPALPEPGAAARKMLLDRLARASAGSRAIVWLWVVLIAAMFMLSAGLAVYHRDDLGFVAASILGGGGVMAYLLAQVRSVHTKLVSTEILLALLPNLPPEQWVKASVVLMDEVLKAPKAAGGAA